MGKNQLDTLLEKLLSSAKYRRLNLPEPMVRDLLARELVSHPAPRQALKEVRKKLHHIVASYLGDLDYEKATKMIEEAFASRDMPTIKSACTQLLAAHISTRERLAILDEFYPRLFAITGKPQTILDLACGLNPLTFPWMDLSSEVQYYAYDIHQPRVRFINHFFTLAGLSPLATWQDVLIEPPQVKADVAFFFKEAHRFEQRQKNSNRVFFQMLPVRFLLVSLPPTSMSGQHNLVEQQRRLVHTSVEGLDWEVTEVSFQNELVFVIEKDQT